MPVATPLGALPAPAIGSTLAGLCTTVLFYSRLHSALYTSFDDVTNRYRLGCAHCRPLAVCTCSAALTVARWYHAWNPFVPTSTAVELFVRGRAFSRPVQGSVAGVAEMHIVVSVAAHSSTTVEHVIQQQRPFLNLWCSTRHSYVDKKSPPAAKVPVVDSVDEEERNCRAFNPQAQLPALCVITQGLAQKCALSASCRHGMSIDPSVEILQPYKHAEWLHVTFLSTCHHKCPPRIPVLA